MIRKSTRLHGHYGAARFYGASFLCGVYQSIRKNDGHEAEVLNGGSSISATSPAKNSMVPALTRPVGSAA
ncbi:hypothetical protein QLX08_004127 [Tetragonisca angustula]|uniref:Uncharacterized protein n=1 Tax=Tetragonisca angustula TaxID=166442 RepID=A0AAW1A370_9HYME